MFHVPHDAHADQWPVQWLADHRPFPRTPHLSSAQLRPIMTSHLWHVTRRVAMQTGFKLSPATGTRTRDASRIFSRDSQIIARSAKPRRRSTRSVPRSPRARRRGDEGSPSITSGPGHRSAAANGPYQVRSVIARTHGAWRRRSVSSWPASEWTATAGRRLEGERGRGRGRAGFMSQCLEGTMRPSTIRAAAASGSARGTGPSVEWPTRATEQSNAGHMTMTARARARARAG